MRAVMLHAEHDLRVEDFAVGDLGPRDVKLRVRNGGICGSDLHYYQHGGFGTVRLRHPMVLGHEVAGEVLEIGAEIFTAPESSVRAPKGMLTMPPLQAEPQKGPGAAAR